jgi:PAS domain S-box-containing protein
MRDAISLGLQVLQTLGVTFPVEPDLDDFRSALRETKATYAGGPVEQLIDLPPMGDPLQVATMRFLVSISAAAFLSAPALYSLLILKQVRMSVQHGNLPASAFCYASYGLILCGAAGEIDEGHAFGTLALHLTSRLNAREWQCKVPSIVASFITHWKAHVRESLEPLLTAHYVGLETGDFQFSAYSSILYAAYAYFAGIEKSLADLQAEMRGLSDTALRTGQLTVHQYFRMLQQAVHELMNGRDSPRPLEGMLYSEQAQMPAHQEANDRNGIFYVHFHKLLLHFLSSEYGEAVEDAARVEQFSDGGTGFPYLPIACFFDSLARLAHFRASPGSSTEELVSRINANQERLRTWARHAPMNSLHRIALVEAERHRTFGGKLEAMEEYDRAIAGARATAHLRDEAIAYELAAEFYADWGKETIARTYMTAAADCYARWGAAAKVQALKKRFPALFRHEPSTAERSLEPPGGSDRFAPVSSLVDLAVIIKATQAIAREIDLPRLLSQLLRIAMENAGAQHGALILDRDGEWVVEAVGDAESRDVTILDAVELRRAEGVSAGVVLAVARTGTGIVLGDAAAEGDFMDDPRITAHSVRSVICTPLVNQGRISGILYLENNLARNAFVASRQELLRMLSTQMALSLDNALLYQKAQKEITERRVAEAALRESEVRFHTIYDSVNDAVFVQDLHTGAIVDVNGTMCSMYGYSRKEALALGVEDLSLGEAPYTEAESRAWLRAAASSGPQMFEWKARDKAGRIFWVEVNMRRASIGGQDRILVVARDITGRKQAEEQIRQLNEDLEIRVQQRTAELAQANQELESFSYSVSHDLRSPLRAIDGYARILEEEHGGALDGEGRRVCGVIRSNAARMDHLINDLLSFSRMGRTELRTTTIDMNALVRSVLEELTQLQEKGRLDVRVADLPPAAGDLAMMRQVWTNLLSNALKFSSKQALMRVEVEASLGADEVVYAVHDNGAGFEMAYAGKLFGVFQRLHTELEFPGTGVGLAIVKRAVLRHGGRVWAEGRAGAGADFYFALPLPEAEGSPR